MHSKNDLNSSLVVDSIAQRASTKLFLSGLTSPKRLWQRTLPPNNLISGHGVSYCEGLAVLYIAFTRN